MKKKNAKTIDYEILRILSTKTNISELVSTIRFIQKASVLSMWEYSFCEEVLSQLEIYNHIDLKLAAEKLEIDNYKGEKIKGYKEMQLIDKVDNFIKTRKAKQNSKALIDALTEANNGCIGKSSLELIYRRYKDVITIEENDSFNQLENLDDNTTEHISTAVSIVDEKINGLKSGTVTSIIGNGVYMSLWAINIAYLALISGKNVLYFSPSDSAETIFKRFLMRHSCDVDKFEKSFSFNNLNNDYDYNNYKIIYNDFKTNHLHKLLVFDESKFNISTHYNILKLLVYAQNAFIENTGNGIDVIIVDDFSFMKLDIGSRCITNQSTVVNEYYKYFRNQSRNLLGTKKSIPIIVAISSTGTYMDTKQIYTAMCNDMKVLSDNILVSYGDKTLEKQSKLDVQVLQVFNGNISDESKSIDVKYDTWCIEYNGKSTKELLKEKEEEVIGLQDELTNMKEEQNAYLQFGKETTASEDNEIKIEF